MATKPRRKLASNRKKKIESPRPADAEIPMEVDGRYLQKFRYGDSELRKKAKSSKKPIIY